MRSFGARCVTDYRMTPFTLWRVHAVNAWMAAAAGAQRRVWKWSKACWAPGSSTSSTGAWEMVRRAAANSRVPWTGTTESRSPCKSRNGGASCGVGQRGGLGTGGVEGSVVAAQADHCGDRRVGLLKAGLVGRVIHGQPRERGQVRTGGVTGDDDRARVAAERTRRAHRPRPGPAWRPRGRRGTTRPGASR